MSIAAKCICGHEIYYCTGGEGCLNRLDGPLNMSVTWSEYIEVVHKLQERAGQLEASQSENERLKIELERLKATQCSERCDWPSCTMLDCIAGKHEIKQLRIALQKAEGEIKELKNKWNNSRLYTPDEIRIIQEQAYEAGANYSG